MGKSTAILIAAVSFGALASLLLDVNPGYGAGYCAGLAMFGITVWVFLVRPGYRWATEKMQFPPLVAAFVGPLVYFAGAFVVLLAGLMLLVQVQGAEYDVSLEQQTILADDPWVGFDEVEGYELGPDSIGRRTRGSLTILTRSETEPVTDWLAHLKQSLSVGKSTVIMHTAADGTLLIGELIVDAEANNIITTRQEASGWAKALAKAGDARVITFGEIAAELTRETKHD
jgi:hypothetical protein